MGRHDNSALNKYYAIFYHGNFLIKSYTYLYTFFIIIIRAILEPNVQKCHQHFQPRAQFAVSPTSSITQRKNVIFRDEAALFHRQKMSEPTGHHSQIKQYSFLL